VGGGNLERHLCRKLHVSCPVRSSCKFYLPSRSLNMQFKCCAFPLLGKSWIALHKDLYRGTSCRLVEPPWMLRCVYVTCIDWLARVRVCTGGTAFPRSVLVLICAMLCEAHRTLWQQFGLAEHRTSSLRRVGRLMTSDVSPWLWRVLCAQRGELNHSSRSPASGIYTREMNSKVCLASLPYSTEVACVYTKRHFAHTVCVFCCFAEVVYFPKWQQSVGVCNGDARNFLFYATRTVHRRECSRSVTTGPRHESAESTPPHPLLEATF
jgi:hypothetical protein